MRWMFVVIGSSHQCSYSYVKLCGCTCVPDGGQWAAFCPRRHAEEDQIILLTSVFTQDSRDSEELFNRKGTVSDELED